MTATKAVRLAPSASQPTQNLPGFQIVQSFKVEVGCCIGKQLFWREVLEAEDDSVGRQNCETFRVHVDEGHHDGRLGIRRLGHCMGIALAAGWAGGGAFAGVFESGLVAVVAVGDDELFVFHGRRQDVDGARVADSRNAMEHTVLIGHFDVVAGLAAEEQALGGLGGVGVEHENLPEVGAGGA